jgi:rhodanese-related sulfurtransferase
MTVSADITMEGLLKEFPGAQRALFRRYHIGGCASCGFRPDETLAEVCVRNDNLYPDEVLETVREAHEQDEAMQIAAVDLQAALPDIDILDIRTKEEFDAVHIPHSRHFDQLLMQEIMGTWAKDRHLVIVDHSGSRCLDAAAYFAGHGFTNIKCLKGGIDAYSQQADPSLPRYTLE